MNGNVSTHDMFRFTPIAHAKEVQRRFQDERDPKTTLDDTSQAIIVLGKDGDDGLRYGHEVGDVLGLVVMPVVRPWNIEQLLGPGSGCRQKRDLRGEDRLASEGENVVSARGICPTRICDQ